MLRSLVGSEMCIRDSRYTYCFAGRSYSIDETAGTPSLSLAAVVTHSREVVVCPGWASPEKRSHPVHARWYQVHTYPVHNTNPTLKPRHFLLPCRFLLPYRFCCSTLKPRLVEYVQTFIAAQIFLFYTKTKISRTHAPRADVYCHTDGTYDFSGVYEIETRFARIIYYY